MLIADMLTPEAVATDFTAASREEAIRRLVNLLAKVRPLDVEAAVKAILARERLGPTLISIRSKSLALVHAHTNACKQIVMALGIARRGISWNVAGGEPAHLVLTILSPPQTQTLYLRVLSRISRLFADTNLLENLLQAASPRHAIALWTALEEPLGAIIDEEGMPAFCVLGAGHGGLAMAAHLAIGGFKVNLFNRTADRIEPIAVRGGIDVDGEINGFATLNRVTSQPAEAIENCDVLMVVVPATAHREMAQAVAPHIRNGQILVLNPGRTGGALEVAKVLREINPQVRPYIAEAQTLLYASRATNPGQVHIFRIKNSVPLAALPTYHITDILPVIQKALPQFIPGDNVLKTSMDNIGAVFHPALTILNAGRIEATLGKFEYYVEGVTPAVAQVLEAIDRERVAVATALGIRANTAREWLYLAYDAAGKTLYDAMRANSGYRGIMAPGTVMHRYISEDVPASLVPIASLGELLGVPTPAIRAIVCLASVMHGVDYWAEGRTVERLGMNGMSVKDIRFLVEGAVETAPLPGAANPGESLAREAGR